MIVKHKKHTWSKLWMRNTPEFRWECRLGKTGLTWGFESRLTTICGRANAVHFVIRLGHYVLRLARTKQDPRDELSSWPTSQWKPPNWRRSELWR